MIYPLSFAHPFAQGEYDNPFPDLPNSQVNVKARHADGSCKHAKFYIVMDGDPGPGQMTFGNITTVNNTGMTADQMLAACPDIELQIWDQNFTQLNHSVLLRNMIGNFSTINASGPICTDVTVHDPAGSVDGTFGPDGLFSAAGNKTVRPVWYVQFWPTINRVRVTLALETGSTRCIQESWYACRILLNGVKVYEHPWDVQGAAKKWFWEKWIGDPVGEVAINHNLAHLVQSLSMPNYDTTIKLQPQAIADIKNQYATTGLSDIRSFTGQENRGLWDKGMSTAGTRTDLGPAPQWVIDYLYSGDQDLFHITIEEAQRACNYQCFYRETYAGTKGYGNAPRVDDRPKSDFLQPGMFADGFEITGDRDGWGWSITDRQHSPNVFYVPYLITGEQWLLDCMIQWAGFWVGVANGATQDNRGRGPTGAEGCIGLPTNYGCRGPGHILEILADAAWICPDVSPYKAYFSTCIVNTLASFEGTHNITGTALQSNPCWTWANTVENNDNPLHLWGRNLPQDIPSNDPAFKPNTVRITYPMWEMGYMDTALRVCADFGFPADALLAWRAEGMKIFADAPLPGPFLAGLQVPTFLGVGGADGQFFTTLQQIIDSFVDGYDFSGLFYNPLNSDKNGSYPLHALMSASALKLWNWYGPNAYEKTDWTLNPHWAIKPRT